MQCFTKAIGLEDLSLIRGFYNYNVKKCSYCDIDLKTVAYLSHVFISIFIRILNGCPLILIVNWFLYDLSATRIKKVSCYWNGRKPKSVLWETKTSLDSLDQDTWCLILLRKHWLRTICWKHTKHVHRINKTTMSAGFYRPSVRKHSKSVWSKCWRNWLWHALHEDEAYS